MSRLALSTACLASLLLVPAAALAHDDPGGSSSSTGGHGSTEPEAPGAPRAPGAPAEKAEAEAGEHEEAEPSWEATADFVGGATTLDVLTQGRPTRIESPPANVFDSMRISSYTFLVGVERHVGERLVLGARIPIIDGELSSRTGQSDTRSVFMVGNLELEGSYRLAHGKSWDVDATLELALPTGGGAEGPTRDEVAADPAKSFEYSKIARFSAARGASFARGSYESALFESGRIGVIPKLAASFHLGQITIRPMVKVENLVDVTGDAAQGYVGEVVAGVRGSMRVMKHVEPGLHVFTNLTYTKHEELNTDALYLEPYLRFPFKAITPQASFVTPVAGDMIHTKTFGVRVAVSAEF